MGHRAKWDEQSFEYHHTPPRFDFPPADQPLLERLTGLARQCWDLFGLRGYVRVDFRVDAAGRPWILEINANPCLSPDAGFAAALAQAGISFAEAVRCILADAGDCPNFHSATDVGLQTAPFAVKMGLSPSHEPASDPSFTGCHPWASQAIPSQSESHDMTTEPSPSTPQGDVTFRYEVLPEDRQRVRAIVESTGFFHGHEVDVAVELVDQRLAKGPASGYHFIFLERGGVTCGYACYGPIACTVGSYDLYWIAVHDDYRGQGFGRLLMRQSEELAAQAGAGACTSRPRTGRNTPPRARSTSVAPTASRPC